MSGAFLGRLLLSDACGVLYAMIAVTYLFEQPAHSFHELHTTVVTLGELTLAAGLCTTARALWTEMEGPSWLLLLNGLTCSALGVIFALWTGPLAFRMIALLIFVMAFSVGTYEFASGQTANRKLQNLVFRAGGTISFVFGAVFLAFVFRWLKLNPEAPMQSLRLLAAYFGFGAIFMLVRIRMRSDPRLHFS